MTQDEFRRHLPAFADGEADDGLRLRVMLYLAAHPEATAAVIHHQQLRQAIGRSMREMSPAVPVDLRARLAEIVNTAPDVTPATPATPALPATPNRPTEPHRSVLARIGRWMPAITAVAAVLVVAVMLSEPGAIISAADGDAVVPVSMTRQFTSRHVSCTRMLADLYDQAAFPSSLEQMPQTVADRLGGQPGALPALDLRGAGFAFERAGMCNIPGKSVHLIYKALPETGHADQISLWIQSAADSRLAPTIEAGKLYRATGRGAVHPIVLWKQGNMLYFITGDAQSSVEDAARELRGA